MRVRVSLEFDILIESFISLCIIETIGAMFREYKPWIVLLITQWSIKVVLHNTVHWSARHTQSLDVFWYTYQMRQLASSLPFPYYKRQTTVLQTFGIPER